MTDEVISPLRRRMIEDMTIRKLTPKPAPHFSQNGTSAGLDRPIGRVIKRLRCLAAAHASGDDPR